MSINLNFNAKKNFLAIIPARAGSKRIPNKNLQLIGNKPMIQFTIESAISSLQKSNILISSDDIKVHNIAKKLGLNVPFIRPNGLSTETATTSSVVMHAVQWYKKEYGFVPDNLILLQPTTPFRTASDIKKSIKQFIYSKKHTLVSACIPMQHPGDFLYKDNNKKFKRLKIIKLKKKINKEKQYPEMYFISGGIYISKTTHFIETGDMIGKDPDIFLTSQLHSIDIDTPFDLNLARIMHQKYMNKLV